jgi:ribonuclease HII
MGIDENGLGPRLGPLVVTGVTVHVTEPGEKIARRAPGRAFSRLGDSKDLVDYKDSSLGEAWARAILRRVRPGASCTTVDDVVHLLSLDERDHLRSACGPHEEQCWRSDESFAAPDDVVAKVERDLDRLAARGIVLRDVRSVILCSQRLNAAADRGTSRFDVDLHAMERLVLAARAREDAEVFATCGKVGGYDRYGAAFGPLAGRLHVAVEEGRKRSTYRFPSLGELSFVRDADATNLLVAMASLVGKWLRDALMARIVRHHRGDDESIPEPSGYHDPVTARFVAATALARRRRALPDDCFERRARDTAPASKRARA